MGQTTATETGWNGSGDVGLDRRNYVLGVGNGVLVRLGMSFINTNLVLAAFVYDVTGSLPLVGLMTTLWAAGRMWPQLYLSSLVEHRPRKKPFYLFASVSRIVLLLGLIAVVFLSSHVGGAGVLIPFFVLLFLFSSAQGCSIPPFMDMVGQTVAPMRRGGFFAFRGLLGGILAFTAGFLVTQPILHRVPTPANYGLLLILGLVCMASAWTMFAFVRETETDNARQRRGFRQIVASGRRMLARSRNYRGLVALRMLFRVVMLGLAFYVPYGVERLGTAGLSGIFVGCIMISRVAAGLIWSRAIGRKGNRVCLIWAGTFFCLSPLAALLAPSLPTAFQWQLPNTAVTLDLPLTAYLLALCLFGLGQEAAIIGMSAFTLSAAPADRRPSYVAFLNTVVFPFTFLPVLAGVLIGDHTSRLPILFGVIALGGFCYVLTAARLTEARDAA